MNPYMIITIQSCVIILLASFIIIMVGKRIVYNYNRKKEWESKMAELELTRDERFKDIMKQTAEVGSDA